MKTLVFQQKINNLFNKTNAHNSNEHISNYAGFIISLALHLALFFSLYGVFYNMDLRQNGESITTLSLATFMDTSNEDSVSETKPIVKKQKHREITKHDGKLAKQEEIITPPQNPPKAQPSENLEEGDVIQTLTFNDGSEDELFSKLKRAIDRKSKYPPMARKQGLEGRVVVEFVIHKNGGVSHIQLVESCPHKSLNLAALNAIKQAQNDFPIFTQTTKNRLPIVYELDRG